jgi:serralysin
MQPGGIEFWGMIHKIGHALGLAHPDDNGSGSTVFPGVGAPFYDYGQNDLDQTIFTVMSYDRGYKNVFGTATDLQYQFGGAATPIQDAIS